MSKKVSKGYDLRQLYNAVRIANDAMESVKRQSFIDRIANYAKSIVKTVKKNKKKHSAADFMHMPRANSKLKTIAAWNLLPVVTCGGKKCPGCYAVKNCLCHGGDMEKNPCLKAWAENTAFMFECERNKDYTPFIEKMSEYLEKYDGAFFRIHASGDFFSVLYLAAWAEIVQRFPHIRFLAFTKQFRTLEKYDAAYTPMWTVGNISVLLSMWPGVEIPAGLSHYRRAWVQDGTETRIPKKAFHCPGDCSTCNAGIPICWVLSQLSEDVYFSKH